MAQVNEKPRKRQFTLELDEDEIAELITWADNPSDDFVRGDVGDALLRTLRRALSGPTRKSEGDNRVKTPSRSGTISDAPEAGPMPPSYQADRQQGRVISTGEPGMEWRERD